VEPELIGTFRATGDDARSRNVRVLMTFRFVPGGMWEDKWVPEAHATLVTDDGKELYGVSDEEARFGIEGSRVTLTTDEPVADIFSRFRSRYRSLMGNDRRVPR
jgi:hypothetical protein